MQQGCSISACISPSYGENIHSLSDEVLVTPAVRNTVEDLVAAKIDKKGKWELERETEMDYRYDRA
jgi:hypothetical protein